MCVLNQDETASSFSDHQINIPAAASSSVIHNFESMWTGRGAVNTQGIPSDDGVLYGGFDKIQLEVINARDQPPSELPSVCSTHPLHHISLRLTVIIILDHGRRGLHD